jgi:hypothetical protein
LISKADITAISTSRWRQIRVMLRHILHSFLVVLEIALTGQHRVCRRRYNDFVGVASIVKQIKCDEEKNAK